MSLEEIYSHFQIPEDDTSNSIFTTTYTSKVQKRIKKQKKELTSKINLIIQDMIDKREQLLTHVFDNEENNSTCRIHARRTARQRSRSETGRLL